MTICTICEKAPGAIPALDGDSGTVLVCARCYRCETGVECVAALEDYNLWDCDCAACIQAQENYRADEPELRQKD